MKVNVISESEFFPKEHGVHSAYLNQVTVLKKLGLEVVINSFKRADIVHIHTIGLLGLYKLFTSAKTVVTAHVIPVSFEGNLIGTKYWLGIARQYLKFFYNKANLVIAVSPKVKTELEKIGVTQRIEVLPNIIDVSFFKNSLSQRTEGRKRLGLKEEKVVLGVGQIVQRKGIKDFIEIASEMPEFIFVWAGGQPLKMLTEQNSEIQNLLKFPPRNFRLIEKTEYSKMPEIYNASDIFLLPSYQENAPMAIIEAAACGLPLLLRDLNEYRLLYQEGYLASRTNDEFKKNIRELFSNKNLFERHKKASHRLAQKFTFDALGNKLMGYYNEL